MSKLNETMKVIEGFVDDVTQLILDEGNDKLIDKYQELLKKTREKL